MSKVAVIADIHGNPFALEAVCNDLDQRGVDEVIVGGDLVGRGPLGSEVVKKIRETNFDPIRGNHEDYLLSFRYEQVPADWLEADKWSASRWMASQLDESDANFISQLPFSARSKKIPELEVFHGSPVAYDDGIGTWTPDKKLADYIEMIDGHILACAHTHRPTIKKLDNGRVVNVGAVGLPFNGDPRAHYALFKKTNDKLKTEIIRVSYPREQILNAYHETGFLVEGGITAQLLYYELKKARPYLVPFLTWAELEERPPNPEAIPAFLKIYREDISPHEFMHRLHHSF